MQPTTAEQLRERISYLETELNLKDEDKKLISDGVLEAMRKKELLGKVDFDTDHMDKQDQRTELFEALQAVRKALRPRLTPIQSNQTNELLWKHAKLWNNEYEAKSTEDESITTDEEHKLGEQRNDETRRKSNDPYDEEPDQDDVTRDEVEEPFSSLKSSIAGQDQNRNQETARLPSPETGEPPSDDSRTTQSENIKLRKLSRRTNQSSTTHSLRRSARLRDRR